jgi:translocation protein SEC66
LYSAPNTENVLQVHLFTLLSQSSPVSLTSSLLCTQHHKAKTIEPYFPPHVERNTYVTLLSRDPPAPDAVLKTALVRRAVGSIRRLMHIQQDKPVLQNLLQRGSVGDDLWNSLLAAEKEIPAELAEIIQEANTFAEGWGPAIFQTANEIIAYEQLRGVVEKIPASKTAIGWFISLIPKSCAGLFVLTCGTNETFIEKKYNVENKTAALLQQSPVPVVASPARPTTPLKTPTSATLSPTLPGHAESVAASSDGEGSIASSAASPSKVRNFFLFCYILLAYNYVLRRVRRRRRSASRTAL